MRKWILTLGLVGISFAGNICGDVKKTLEKHAPLKGLPYKVVSTRPIGGLCEVVIEIKNQLIPLYTNGKLLISGEAWIYKKPITQVFLNKLRKKIYQSKLRKLDEYTVAVYNPKGEKVVYFVADPECPYSNWVKEQVKHLADSENATVKLVFLPLPFHKGSAKKVEAFICSRKTFEDYLQGNYGNSTCQKGEQYVKNILKDLPFLKATPTFLIPEKDNFEVVVGTNLERLKQILKNRN